MHGSGCGRCTPDQCGQGTQLLNKRYKQGSAQAFLRMNYVYKNSSAFPATLTVQSKKRILKFTKSSSRKRTSTTQSTLWTPSTRSISGACTWLDQAWRIAPTATNTCRRRLYNRDYGSFDDLNRACKSLNANAHNHRAQLHALLTKNFQIISQ